MCYDLPVPFFSLSFFLSKIPVQVISLLTQRGNGHFTLSRLGSQRNLGENTGGREKISQDNVVDMDLDHLSLDILGPKIVQTESPGGYFSRWVLLRLYLNQN